MNISQLRGYSQHIGTKRRADDELHDKTKEIDLVPSRNGQFDRELRYRETWQSQSSFCKVRQPSGDDNKNK
jgi:hypothetical protein